MTLQIPEYDIANANVSALLISSLTTPSAPKVSEMSTALEITCYFPEDWDGVSADQDSGTQTRMCIAEEWDVPGSTKRAIADIEYTYKPQLALTTTGNKLYAALTPGLTMFLLLRYAIAPGTAPATTQKGDVVGITAGSRSKKPSGKDNSAPLTVTQKLFINRSMGVYEDVTLVA